MTGQAVAVYEFGPFRLDERDKVLVRQGRRLLLTPKQFDLLLILIKKSPHLVTKDVLIQALWPETPFTSDTNLNQTVSTLRDALGDEFRQYIKTEHRLGYRFTAPVHVVELATGDVRKTGIRRIGALAVVIGVLLAVIVLFWASRRNRRPTKTKVASVSAQRADALKYFELARRYEAAGDDTVAVATLSLATTVDPTFADAYLEAARICDRIGEDDNASQYLDRAEEAAKGLGDQHLDLAAKALRYVVRDERKQARGAYKILVDRYPDDVFALYYKADLAMDSRREFPQADDALRKCLQIAPKNTLCNFDMQMLQVRRGHFDEVLQSNASLESTGVRFAWFDEPIGLAWYGKGDFDKAIDYLNKLSRNKHVVGDVHYRAGKELLADIPLFRGRISEAVKQIEELVLSDRDDERTRHLLYLAEIYALTGEEAAARRTVGRVLKSSDDVLVLIDCARVSAAIGDREYVRKLLATKTSEGNIAELMDAGTRYFVNGALALHDNNIKQALRDLSSSFDADDDLLYEYFLMQAHLHAQDWRLAMELLTDLQQSKGAIIANDAHPPLIWTLTEYYLGICAEKMGNKREALQHYSNFLDIWKLADSNLQQVSDARKRVVEIQGGRRA